MYEISQEEAVAVAMATLCVFVEGLKQRGLPLQQIMGLFFSVAVDLAHENGWTKASVLEAVGDLWEAETTTSSDTP